VVLPVAATDADGNHMVLSVQSRETTQVGEMELAFLTTVAHLGAIAVEKAKRLEAERAQSERLRRTLAVNESLLARALAGDSLTNLLGTVEVLLPEPFLVVDLTTHSILARRSPAQNMINAVDWQRFVRRKAARLLMDLAQDTAPDGFGARTMIDFAPCGLGLRLEALVSPMRIDQEPVGALVLFPAAAVGDPLDLLLAQETSRAINVHLLRSYERERSRVESAGELISALIQGAPLGSEAVWSRAEQLGVNLAPPGCLLAIGLPDATPPQSGQHYRALSLLTSRLWPGALIGPQGVDVTVLLPGAADRLRHVTVLAKQIVRELTWRGTQPAIAISEVCHGLADYPRAWRASRRLLALGRSFGRSGVLSHDAFGPFAELLATMDGTTVQDFVTRTLGNAGPGNAGQHERLLETVANFLDHGCRYQASADSLGIHVSTLRYRIGRFQEATSTDLTDPDTCFSLALALRLRQLHQTGMTAS
jgi:purine catabolism regulator